MKLYCPAAQTLLAKRMFGTHPAAAAFNEELFASADRLQKLYEEALDARAATVSPSWVYTVDGVFSNIFTGLTHFRLVLVNYDELVEASKVWSDPLPVDWQRELITVPYRFVPVRGAPGYVRFEAAAECISEKERGICYFFTGDMITEPERDALFSGEVPDIVRANLRYGLKIK